MQKKENCDYLAFDTFKNIFALNLKIVSNLGWIVKVLLIIKIY